MNQHARHFLDLNPGFKPRKRPSLGYRVGQAIGIVLIGTFYAALFVYGWST